MKVINAHDFQYRSLVNYVLTRGVDVEDRTGVGSRSCFGTMLQFNLTDGFPALTLKKLYWKTVVAELLGFWRGYTSAAQFRALGCNIWDDDANENVEWLNNPHRKGEDDLGRIYGVQWRDWQGSVDQIKQLVDQLRNNRQSRRMLVTAWNPAELNQLALPPCHTHFQCRILPVDNISYLHLKWDQRSMDSFLGAPFNIASYALLAHILAGLSHCEPGSLTGTIGDYHLYQDQLEPAQELLRRKSYPACKLKIHWPSGNLGERFEWMEHRAGVDDFELIGYQSGEPMRVKMATTRAPTTPAQEQNP